MGHPFVAFEEEKGKTYQACILSRTRPRHRSIIYLGEARGPITSDQSLRCTRREGQHILRQPPGETRDCSGRAYSSGGRRRLLAGTFLGPPDWTTQPLEFRCRGRRGGIWRRRHSGQRRQSTPGGTPGKAARKSTPSRHGSTGSGPSFPTSSVRDERNRPAGSCHLGGAGPDRYELRVIRSGSPSRQGVDGKPDARRTKERDPYLHRIAVAVLTLPHVQK